MNIDTLLDSLIIEQVPSAREAYIVNTLVAEGVKEKTPKNENSVVELTLPPMNEAEFFAKILWQTLYPNEPTIDPYFGEMVTRIIYNIADAGKLHKALADWITDKLMETGKARDVSTAENQADSMLNEYEDYNDILNEINKPKTKQVVKDKDNGK